MRVSRWRTAKDYPGKDFDLVTFFDCLHDMGDPAGAAAHVRQSLKKTARGWSSSRWPAIAWKTTSTRSAGCFTLVRPWSACRHHWRRKLAQRLADRPARRGCARSLLPAASAASGARPKRRSTCSGGASVANAGARPVNALTFLSNAGRKQSPFHPPPATCAFVVGGGRPTLRQRGGRPTRRRAVVALAGITDRNVRCNPVANPASPESGQSRKQYRPQAASASAPSSDVRCDRASSLFIHLVISRAGVGSTSTMIALAMSMR